MINATTIEVMNLPILNATSKEAIESPTVPPKDGFFVNAHCVNVA